MNKKIILGIVIVAVLILGVSYVVEKRSQLNIKSVEKRTNLNLKTYKNTNSQHGFEFQYPANAKVQDVCCQGAMVADLLVYYPSTINGIENQIDVHKAVFLQLHDDDYQTFADVEVKEETPNNMFIKIGKRAMNIGVSDTGYKDLFKIISSTFKFTSPSISTPSITILSPNGGEVWKMGQTYTISYSISGDWGPVTIKLNRYSDDSSLIQSIDVGTSNTNSFIYKVPASLEDTKGSAGRYKIEIYPATARELVKRSDYFSIIR